MKRKAEIIEKIDKFIGSKVYEVRIASGMSRKKLASLIGVSGVQLQKYEQGINSINANERMILIASALEQKVSYFFEGLEQAKEAATLTKQQRKCLEVAKNFRQIKLASHREAVNNLIEVLATDIATAK